MTSLEKAISNYLKTIPCWFIKTNPRAYGGKWGIPDFIVCYKGKFYGLEAKSLDDTATKLQDLELKSINEAGGIGRIVRSVADVRAILNQEVLNA